MRRGCRYLIPMAILGLMLLPACSKDTGVPDAGNPDADGGADLDPCEVAIPAWEKIWNITKEPSGLEGRTPDINLMDVWGVGPDDIYAVGFAGSILHYDGSEWTLMETTTEANLEGVWGYVLHDADGTETRRDVFAVGSEGTILRLVTDAWIPMDVINDPDPANPDPQPVTDTFHDVWGIPAPGPDQATQHPTVIAVGGMGLIARYDGAINQFMEMRQRVEFTDSEGQIHVNYERWTPERLGGVFGAAAGDFVAVGNNGAILEFDGSSWNRNVITGFITHLNGVWGRGAWQIFAVGNEGTIMQRSNGAWEDLKTLAEQQGGFIQISASAYLRSSWGFYQAKCGELPDGGVDPDDRQDTSWQIFIGWDNKLYLFHDRAICPFGEFDVSRLEGIWGNQPRGEQERTYDGGIECDTVEVILTGVNGKIYRLTNDEGR
jgi:hypothetical protein